MRKLLFAIFCSACAFCGSAQTDPSQKIDPVLIQRLAKDGKADFLILMRDQADVSAAAELYDKTEKGTYVFSTLTAFASKTQNDVLRQLDGLNVKYQSYWLVNAARVSGDLRLANLLAQRTDVAQVVSDARGTLQYFGETGVTGVLDTAIIPWGILKIKADSVWAMGIRGQGAVVGGEDTGYDWTHPAIQKNYRGWNNGAVNHNYNWHDAIHADTSKHGNPCGYDIRTPCDDQSHGTHTMGTMVGSDSATQHYIGVAPGARWIGARNMDQGNGTLSSYVEDFQWFIAPTDTLNKNPRPDLAPHVINNSWYCAIEEGCNSTNFSVLEKGMNNTRAAGIVVVVSVGNAGPNCSSASGPPGFFAKAFSIGATGMNDTIAGFSSRGPVTVDSSGRLKPDVSAPGVGVISSVLNHSYASYSGTSMSGPHTAGTVALMISANPKLAGQVDAIEKIIKNTAKPLQSSQSCGVTSGMTIPNNTYGYGRIDALAAVRAALAYKPTTPTTEVVSGSSVRVYPNPFTELVHFETPSTTGALRLTVYDVDGRTVYNNSWESSNSTSLQTISSATWAPGMYFYRIAGGQNSWSGKIYKH